MDHIHEIPLRVGDAGSAVLEVQRILSALGYPIAQMDGNFDTRTLRAVIAFQSDSSLPIDGVVAVNTWMALQKHTKPQEKRQERPMPLVPPEAAAHSALPVPLAASTEPPPAPRGWVAVPVS